MVTLKLNNAQIEEAMALKVIVQVKSTYLKRLIMHYYNSATFRLCLLSLVSKSSKTNYKLVKIRVSILSPSR